MKLSQRDWVQLSAYLDGELNRKDMDQLSNRIDGDPVLQAVLEDLKTAKTILQNTPRLIVPRNFSLTAAQAGINRIKPVTRVYSLAAALMSILLIGVMILDFSSIFSGDGFAPAMAPIAEDIMFNKAAESEIEEIVEEPALMAVEAEQETNRAADEELPPQASTPAAAAEREVITEDSAVPAAEAVEGLAEEDPTASEIDIDVAAADEDPQAVGAESPGEAKSTDQAHAGQTAAGDTEDQVRSDQTLPSATIDIFPHSTQPVTHADDSSPREFTRRQVPILRIVEIILLLGVFGFGSAAWVIRRRNLK